MEIGTKIVMKSSEAGKSESQRETHDEKMEIVEKEIRRFAAPDTVDYYAAYEGLHSLSFKNDELGSQELCELVQEHRGDLQALKHVSVENHNGKIEIMKRAYKKQTLDEYEKAGNVPFMNEASNES